MLYILCVLYEKNINEITSINNFLKLLKYHDNVKILIYDNSQNVHNDNNIINNDNVIYVYNNGNIGLSKSYNKAINTIQDDNDWIMLTDDDTYFSYEYLDNIYKEVMTADESLLTGVVKTKYGILSPKYINGRQEGYIGRIPIDVYCINSGMCIKRSVYNQIGKYDEKFFLDMIDYWFFDELRRHNYTYIRIVEGNIFQNFSGHEKSSLKSMLKRYNIYKKDFCYYCNIERKGFVYKYSILIKRLIKILYLTMV